MSSSDNWWKEEFGKKSIIQDKIRTIAKSNPLNTKLGEIDTEFMLNVFKHHPQFEDKCGNGFRGVIVKKDTYGNRCFHIERKDGSTVDISWHHALSPKTNKRKWFLAALREEIKGQVFALKKNCGTVCGICGGEIEGDMHVDHLTPFREMVREFFDDDVHDTVDHGDYSLLKDRVLASRWKEYHAIFAILQPTHAKCNLKKG